MLTYRHGERPDLKGVGWHLFWIVWCAIFAGYDFALRSWPTLAVQLICLTLWVYWTCRKLQTLTWHIVEIHTPDREESR